MNDCIFCRILNGEIPAEVVHKSKTGWFMIIKDRAPAAPTHLLVIGKDHAADITEASDVARTKLVELAWEYGKANLPKGFRIVINTGDDAGQTVKHFHVHLLGGEKLKDI